MRSIKNIIFAFFIFSGIAVGGALFWISRHYVVPIITYHHVGYTQKPDPLYVSPENFEKQMVFLAEQNFKVLSFHDFIEAIVRKQPLSKKSVVLTFDDGNPVFSAMILTSPYILYR